MRLRVATLEDADAVSAVLGPSYTRLMAAAYEPDLLAVAEAIGSTPATLVAAREVLER